MMKNRTGRRPGDQSTRDEVLAAARATFAERGFAGATIRAIAARAGVDPALVLHYFHSKRALFVAAADLPVNVPGSLTSLLGHGDPDAGEKLVRLFLGVWENAPTRDAFTALIRAAMTDDEAAAILRERLGAEVIGPVAEGIVYGDSARRAALVGAQLVGLAVARYIVCIPALAQMDADQVARAVAPALQHYIAGSLEEPEKDVAP